MNIRRSRAPGLSIDTGVQPSAPGRVRRDQFVLEHDEIESTARPHSTGSIVIGRIVSDVPRASRISTSRTENPSVFFVT